MPLPFVSLIPKQTETESKYSKLFEIIFYVSMALVVFAIIFTFYLKTTINKINKNIESLESVISAQKSQENIDLEQKITLLSQKIKNFDSLIKSHKISSKIFGFFEETIHPNIWISDLRLFVSDNRAEIFGQSNNLQSLAEQIIIFKNNKNVREVLLDGVSFNVDGKINFTMRINLFSGIFIQ